MKIAVIGASGRTGREFVNAALGAGHDIRAGVYRSEVFKNSDHLQIVRGDAQDAGHIETLITGCDIVVSMLGHVKDSPAFVQTTAISHALSAMKRHHIKRLVVLTGTGVRRPGDSVSIIDRLLNLSISLVDPARMHDGRAYVDVIKDSGVDWTVVRVLKLSSGLEQSYSLTLAGPAKTYVSRRTVAEALLRIIHDNTHIHEMPVISS